MSMDGIQHSKCVQREVSNPTDAAGVFADTSNNEICIVVIPKDLACCCCHFPYLSIPSGYNILWQRWYRHQGQLEPGVKPCWPFWNRVSHMVTQATITYNAPSRQVPTADNVMVDINLSLTFRIEKSTDDAYAFVYKLGTTRFDEFLAAEVEEGIRGLVYSVTHDRVNDLREEFAQGMLMALAKKFLPYGVHIRNVKITEVRLPIALQDQLEQTTAFKSRIAEIAKKHENTIRVITDEASQQQEQVIRTNNRRTQDLMAQCQKYEIEHKEIVDEMIGSARVQEMEAQSKIDVAIGQAKGDLEVASSEGARHAEEVRRKMQISCDERKVKADQAYGVTVLASEAVLNTTENEAQSLIASAEAENNSTAGLEVKRKYELEWERLEIMQELAASGRRFVSGEAGQSIIKDMVPSAGLGGKADSSKKTFF
eukprot:CAMPEP_0183355166 /NCGR_PEP_ID=MMETSP0164_2-20130417/39391_1 /TAXON_ID=221442 /ORGANISM="Coccolithus pelagicus ssp braarudi, Strain PLY182g" /LENGTH=425 /DNA_ID=CAMNT_0025528195 /DNA_START=39 /DNA_END=1316 /DNA_ORIENTATION=-